MKVRSGFIDSIGNTPLIRLRAASQATGCDIYGKAEFLNPGGSIKDRAALAMIEDAEKQGKLQPGGVIVEGTADNVGIGIALVANACGYRSVIVMPETQSQEKKDMLRLCGADLRLVPAVPSSNPNHFARYSGRLAEELAATEPNGTMWANQFDNTANRDGHYRTTGPEIWEQTDGKVDGFVCSVGSGGTLAGVARALKERNANVSIALADPMGAALYSWFTKGEFKAEGNSITESIGQIRVTKNLEGTPIDFAYQITDEEALPVLFDLVEHEGPRPRRLERHQYRGRHAACARVGARQNHRHHPRRWWSALSVQSLQRGFPALEEPAGTVVDEVKSSEGGIPR